MSISLTNTDTSNLNGATTYDVGAAIKKARETVGYSIDDLAVTCGLANTEISEIEGGAGVDFARLSRIAAALQVPASTFLRA
jgi:transcriptional regulator with XRE-family HTH domain